MFYDGEPDRPDDCITVRVTDGTSFGSTMDGELQGNFGLQVRVRAADYDAGWAKADAVQTALAEGVTERVVAIPSSPARYLIWCFSKVGDVIPLGLDKPTGRRNLFVLNADATINQLA